MHFILTIIMNIVVIINVKSMRSNHFREQSSIEMLENAEASWLAMCRLVKWDMVLYILKDSMTVWQLLLYY
jgi:hypothetical protein